MQRGRNVYLGLVALGAVLALGPSRPAAAAVPGWQDKTVGDTAEGTASVDGSGVWTIQGSGNDVWARQDEFHIVYKPLKGDGSVTTKLLSAEEGSEWSKFGVMMREDLESEAAEMLTLVPDSRAVAIPSAGHNVPEERPGTFARIVRQFFAQTGGPSA